MVFPLVGTGAFIQHNVYHFLSENWILHPAWKVQEIVKKKIQPKSHCKKRVFGLFSRNTRASGTIKCAFKFQLAFMHHFQRQKMCHYLYTMSSNTYSYQMHRSWAITQYLWRNECSAVFLIHCALSETIGMAKIEQKFFF